MFRAYASDEVYELIRSNGATPTNWKGAKVRSFWGPIASTATQLAKDGIFILKEIPFKPLIPAPFHPGFRHQVNKTTTKIKGLFHKYEGSCHVTDWEEFQNNPDLYPTHEDSVEYASKYPNNYIIPIFFNHLPTFQHVHQLVHQPIRNQNALLSHPPGANVSEQVAMHSPRWTGNSSLQPYMFPRATVDASLQTSDLQSNPTLLEEIRLKQLTDMTKDCENLHHRTLEQLVIMCKHLGLVSTGSADVLAMRLVYKCCTIINAVFLL